MTKRPLSPERSGGGPGERDGHPALTGSLGELARLAGRRVLVVGGGLGIGRATAILFAAPGASLAILDVDGDRASAVADEVSSTASKAIPLVADVTVPGAPSAAFQEAVAALGGLDALVNIVGRGGRGELLERSVNDQHELMKINYLHHVEFGLAFGRHCREAAHPGSMTVVASIAGLHPAPGQTFYSAAKAALLSLVESMALEWGRYGVRVNAVAPGLTSTDRNRRVAPDDSALAAAIPLGRVGDQSEIAAAVVFLTSDLASYINGHALVVDGGLSLKNPLWLDVAADPR